MIMILARTDTMAIVRMSSTRLKPEGESGFNAWGFTTIIFTVFIINTII
jgi:hypothetical protein